MAEENISQAAQVEGVAQESVVQSEAPLTPRKTEDKSNKKIWIIIIIVIVLLVGVGGWFVFSSPGDDAQDAVVEEITPTRAPTSTPTPSEEIEKEEISIQVLNGTGVAGEATFVQEELEAIGYSDIEAENADSKDAVKTTVTFVNGVSEAVQDEISELLEEFYETVVTDTASSLGGFDVKILLGYRVGHTPTPTESESTPTPTEAESETTPTNSPTPTTSE